VRLALWTPRAGGGWVGAIVKRLAREADLVVVEADPATAVSADVHVYDVADDPAHGHAYRALLRRPGVVVLEHWCLHRLVHAETAGRGDAAAYRREARLGRGETGTFVADQVLAGRGGALPSLVAWNERVLAAALALGATSEDVAARARARLGSRPVLRLAADDAGAAARGLLSLARGVARDGERLLLESRRDRAPEGTLLALALDEVRPAALSLGLPGVPTDVRPLVAGLLPEER
jgi:hypothetical protein